MRLIDLDAKEPYLLDGRYAVSIPGNASTVETDIEVVAKDAYKQGYTDGWKERFGEPEERPQGEWIPVGERLPNEANQSYLVTVDYGDGIVCSCQRFFFGEGIGWNDDCVIAWQPLPAPYKTVVTDKEE